MLVLLVFLFPVVLLLLMVAMDLVERPLLRDGVEEQVLRVVADAPADQVDELEAAISSAYGGALDSYWRRHPRTQLPRGGRSRLSPRIVPARLIRRS